MLVTADWVLPIVGEPIREGAVLIRNGVIEAVGTAAALARLQPGASRYEYPGCVLCPGFVNAHTHLALTVLAGLLEPQPFARWLPRVAKATQALDVDDFSAATVAGALQCISHGVTVVGDVSYGPEGLASAADVGLGGTFYWEVLGATPSEIADTLTEREFPLFTPHCGTRTTCGLSAHAPYTSGPDLIRELHRVAREADIPFMMHVAESPAEMQLLTTGDGPLAPTAERLAFGFAPPKVGAIRYLQRLGALEGTALVHCVLLQPDEFELLGHTAGVVLCPRSNAFLRNGRPDIERLRESGARIALGTDSSGSNIDLDLRAEARALRELLPSISARELLRMMTTDAAAVLGFAGKFGQLSAGALADFTLFSVGPTDQPEEAVVESRTEHVEAVMSGGVWRLREGRFSFPEARLEPKMTRATQKVRAALA